MYIYMYVHESYIVGKRGFHAVTESLSFFFPQEEYYLTHQCFFTNRALYLLVWNVTDGSDGIKSLTVWLQNLQVSLT